jgi:OSK domain
LGNTVENMGQTYRQLVNILDSKGANPIVTTLAPLANNDSTVESKLKQFNRFLKSMFSNVVDLEMVMRQLTSGRPDSSSYER